MPEHAMRHELNAGFVAEMLREWLDVNAKALRIQNHLPPEVLAQIIKEDRGFDPMSYAVVSPRRMRAAEQWLTACITWLEAPVSHPSGTMAPTTDAGNGATVERDEEVQSLREEVAMLRRVILRHLEDCPQHPPATAEVLGQPG